jgi:hypothetical protein
VTIPGTSRNVTLNGVDNLGNIPTGYATFKPTPSILADTTAGLTIPTKVVKAPLVAGAFTVPLLCTNATNVNVHDWTYLVELHLNGHLVSSFWMPLPTGGGDFDLSAAVAVTPSGGIYVPAGSGGATTGDITAALATAHADAVTLRDGQWKQVSTTTYTLDRTDAGKTLECTNASGCTITVPAAELLALGASGSTATVGVCQAAAGQVIIAAGGGVTLKGGEYKTRAVDVLIFLMLGSDGTSVRVGGDTVA